MGKYFSVAGKHLDAGNPVSALRSIRAGIARGELDCLLSLGYYFDNGIGVRRDDEKAAYWYAAAYHLASDPAGAHNLAMLYERVGNLRRAEHYFHESVRLGLPESLSNLAKLEAARGRQKIAKKYLQQLLALDSGDVIAPVRSEAKRLLKRMQILDDR